MVDEKLADSKLKLKNFKLNKEGKNKSQEKATSMDNNSRVVFGGVTQRMDVDGGYNTANEPVETHAKTEINVVDESMIYRPATVLDTFEESMPSYEEPRGHYYEEDKVTLQSVQDNSNQKPDLRNARTELRNYSNDRHRNVDVNNFEIGSSKARTLKPENLNNVKEISLNVFNIDPVQIPRIIDTEGYISDSVRRVEDASGIAVLPFDVAQLLPQVEELKGHKIIYIKGNKYVTGITRVVSKGRLETFVEEIKGTIMRGQIFDQSLIETVSYNGKTFDTLKFNHYELSMLNSMFINIQFMVYEDSVGDIRMNVGGYAV